MRTADFDYELPPELIAQHPPDERDAARMLVLDPASGDATHTTIRELPRYLDPGDLLVLNDSRVIPARLIGHRR
ncbi:MAG TPA: S-adenosylmethionine:tRNA ribosyltransferase-isomerase, partial [Candidatus Dormibacteraeota bacterium]|nr:S-adenosylmethionine:tRNA ribosyltransferase-isomerase [Candidatus Dormibacteraeota bacterium]